MHMLMRSWVVESFQMSLAVSFMIISLSLNSQVQAQQGFSSNPDDYDVGWLVAGVPPPGKVPSCAYCVNAFQDSPSAPSQYLDRLVGIYKCTALRYNELWAYHKSTSSIVFSNLTQVLCLDALLWLSNATNPGLHLYPCNSSLVTQNWVWEGNRVRSGLTDNGGPLYLWGEIPDIAIIVNDIIGRTQLTIASSQPSDEPNVGPYTSNFTFLSIKNWVDKSSTDIETNRLTKEGLLQISLLPPGQITNGDFETSTIFQDANHQIRATDSIGTSYFPLCGWVIHDNPIDYVIDGLLKPANGSYNVHLANEFMLPGSISQTFRTDKGKEYSLSFYFTGFPPTAASGLNRTCGADYSEARLQVQVTNLTSMDTLAGLLSDGTLTQNFTSNVTGLTLENVGWKQETVIFTASTNVTTIFFNSLNFNESCGPMIDTVQVSPTKKAKGRNTAVLGLAGSIGGLAGLLAILGFVYRLYYYTTPEDYSFLYKTEYARIYSERELSIATKKFSSILGEGGFGTVYKADLPDGKAGAVKVEKPKGPNSSSKVLASDEIAVLLRVHHRNLVNLIGFCVHKGRHMLVFEYLPNGSLYDRLHQSILPVPPTISTNSVELLRLRSTVIPWKQRVRIAADVACGLEYLHHEADPPIVHRDVKSQNILLTTTDSAKLADFGLSKAAPANATSFQSIDTLVKGSIGYLDPQYFLTGIFSPKCDVYSFGVVLLELISGHHVIYNAAPLASWAVPYMTNPCLYHELVDKKLNGEFDVNELETLVDLSRMCMQEDGKFRPNMRQVLAFLNSRQVRSIGEESSGRMEENLSRDSYYKKISLHYESQPQGSSSGDMSLAGEALGPDTI